VTLQRGLGLPPPAMHGPLNSQDDLGSQEAAPYFSGKVCTARRDEGTTKLN
jgi:hypothetical protein